MKIKRRVYEIIIKVVFSISLILVGISLKLKDAYLLELGVYTILVAMIVLEYLTYISKFKARRK